MTINDIAAALNISKTTVSRAITGNGRISEETRKRVADYIETNNFYPNTIAQSLARLRTQNIAFSVPNQHEFGETPFFLKCLVGVIQAANKQDFDVMVVGNTLTQLRRIVERKKVDGVILSRSVQNDVTLDYLLNAGIPFMLVGSSEKREICQIDHDHFEACKQLTQNLLVRWSGKFGLLCGSQKHMVNQSRAGGFLAATAEHGLSEDRLVHWETEEKETLVRSFEEMYQADVQNFICGDDVICACLLNYLQEKGAQVNVASFYDSSILGTFHRFVPTIRFDAITLGEKACEHLMSQLDGDVISPKTLVGYKLVR
jgi:DNA-binding LacI/PurR family transcriptional regulator